MAEPLTIQPVDPNDTNYWDIVKATQYGVFERCRQIVEKDGYDVRKADSDNITVLHWAAINNRHELVKYYLSAGAIVDAIGGDLNSTPLQWAVRQGHQSMVALLINSGADPTIRDGEGTLFTLLKITFSNLGPFKLGIKDLNRRWARIDSISSLGLKAQIAL